jgi:hypothetical protein
MLRRSSFSLSLLISLLFFVCVSSRGHIEPSDAGITASAAACGFGTSFRGDVRAIKYEVETPKQKHIAALQMGCYVQSLLAQHSVSIVEAALTRDNWTNGVYIVFESAVSRVFFETYVFASFCALCTSSFETNARSLCIGLPPQWMVEREEYLCW